MPKLTRPRFTLRTLLIAVAVCAVVIGAWRALRPPALLILIDGPGTGVMHGR